MRITHVPLGTSTIILASNEYITGVLPVARDSNVEIVISVRDEPPSGVTHVRKVFVADSHGTYLRPAGSHMEYIGSVCSIDLSSGTKLKEDYVGSGKIMIEDNRQIMIIGRYVVYLINEEADE